MKLTSKLAREFDAGVRSRGQQYYWQSLVRIQRGSAHDVEAEVRGSGTYRVVLRFHDDTLVVSCTCQYFSSNGPCKHLWATVLAAEMRGLLAAAVAAPKLILDEAIVEDEDEDLDSEGEAAFVGRSEKPWDPQPNRRLSPDKTPPWKALIARIPTAPTPSRSSDAWPAKRQLLYLVDATASLASGSVVVKIGSRDRKADGTYSGVVSRTLRRGHIAELPLAEDREILSVAAGAIHHYGWSYSGSEMQLPPSLLLPYPLAQIILPRMARTGRLFLQKTGASDDLTAFTWDDRGPWRLELDMQRDDAKPSKGAPPQEGWTVSGILRRPATTNNEHDERLDLATPALITKGGFVFANGTVAPLAPDTTFEWIPHLRTAGRIRVPEQDRDEFMTEILSGPGVPSLQVPEELRYEEFTPEPRPTLKIREARENRSSALHADLSFDYEGWSVSAHDAARGSYDAVRRRYLRRNVEGERAAATLLSEAGLKYRAVTYWEPQPGWDLPPAKLPRAVRLLVTAGWHIEAEGKVFRRPGAVRLEVSSGVDWFELHGGVEYGDTSAKLPELLEAARRGDTMVRLGDGTYGLLPEEWLRRVGMLAGMGASDEGHIRFRRSQAGLLDALLASQPEATFDATFAQIRQELGRFQGVKAAAQPKGFKGHLRDYQREGLGWMEFLRRFSFGGCLADDMGVGKTAQVLALLETRRVLRAGEQGEDGEQADKEDIGPSLVVVPKSLVFNWKQEAERFTPNLRVLDYTGITRAVADFSAVDVVITTYGTLRRDAVQLKDVAFDYVVLDESQAVKNAGTESAKAVRLLRGNHRLALSGTPVENHLGELWALFDFLNPGMLGSSTVLKLSGGAARNPDDETRRLLAQALRPFILRRTKEEVASELPKKTEQTVYCEMEPPQRKLYNELREHYRQALLQRVQTQGLTKSKIQILEALLRLRQAACHPGLIDKKRLAEPSAKLDVLLEQLREVVEGGHKALVFSQFTSFLAIVRDRLDQDNVAYEYLDGATRDRQACVERFQNDPACPLFLISLKAGGLGLNLTAAEYVFLLDPWWNPAVEAQAVDRAHRIGQTKKVFAYRLIARDTVEEKVLELQKTKRDLAAAIIGADNSLIRGLKREDLELLLS